MVARIVRDKARLVCISAFLVLLTLSKPTHAGAEFTLGPGDRVAVSIFKRPDLSGEFRVTPAGLLSLPYVRGLPVAGLSLAEAHGAVLQRLREDAFLLDPRVMIELVEARPIFVSGDVTRPGAYPYQLGMTVLRAVASAGGMRTLELDDLNARLAVIQIGEKVRLAQQTIGLAILHRARLVTERADQNDFSLPDEARRFLSAEKSQEAMENERAQLKQRNGAFHSQLGIMTTEITGFQEEIVALTDQAAAKRREAELALQESRYVENLQRQGLTPRTARVNELQRLAVQLDGEQSQIGAAIARSRGELARIGAAMNTLTNQREIDLLNAVKDADDTVSSAQVSIDTARTGLSQAQMAALAPEPGLATAPPATFAIDRIRPEIAERIEAQANTPVAPGDLVVVSAGNRGMR